MPIQVTCPKCLKRFQVSDKFAGKKGPCPSCKNTITVPTKEEEVVIHAPDDGAPKDRTGQSILKPILREETAFTRRGLILTITAVLGVFIVAMILRIMFGGIPLWAQILGLIALAPPLVRTGYSFVYDQELEPYQGEDLRNRVLLCSGLFASLWILYAFIPTYLFDLDRASEMGYMTFGIMFCIMLGIGTFISISTFDIETVGGLAHAGLYLLAVVLLAVVGGVTLAGTEVVDEFDRPETPRSVVAPLQSIR